MSRGYPSMTALLGLLAIAGSAAGVPVPVASLVRDRGNSLIGLSRAAKARRRIRGSEQDPTSR